MNESNLEDISIINTIIFQVLKSVCTVVWSLKYRVVEFPIELSRKDIVLCTETRDLMKKIMILQKLIGVAGFYMYVKSPRRKRKCTR